MLVLIDDRIINMDHIESIYVYRGCLYFYTIRDRSYYYFEYTEEKAQAIAKRIFFAYNNGEKIVMIKKGEIIC